MIRFGINVLLTAVLLKPEILFPSIKHEDRYPQSEAHATEKAMAYKPALIDFIFWLRNVDLIGHRTTSCRTSPLAPEGRLVPIKAERVDATSTVWISR